MERETTAARTFIRIGYGWTIDAATIAAYLPYEQHEEISDNSDAFFPYIVPLNGRVGARTVCSYIRLTNGEWLCSALSCRTIDNRLRTSGCAIV